MTADQAELRKVIPTDPDMLAEGQSAALRGIILNKAESRGRSARGAVCAPLSKVFFGILGLSDGPSGATVLRP